MERRKQEMDAEKRKRCGVRIAFVGPCGSGKSTIAMRLRAMGVDARMPAQEHSGVPAMWQKMLDPDLLFVLDAPNPVLRERRPGIDLNDDYLAEQRRRLAHAVAHADFHFDTSTRTPDDIIAAVLARLKEREPMIADRLTELLRDVVAINSISPTLAAGPGEGQLASWLLDWFHARDIAAWQLPVPDGRANVVALIRGRGEEAPLMLNAHMDTVGTDEMAEPFTLRVDGDRLWGRGAYDMKCAIAIMLALAEEWRQAPPRRDVWLTFVSDEEDISRGSEALVREWLPSLDNPPSAVIVLEPTEEEIGIAHRGFAWCEVIVTGRAAHGSLYGSGVDAIFPLGAAIEQLRAIEQDYAEGDEDPILGRASLHASVVEGGSAWSIYPAHARLTWERRTMPDETGETLRAQVERAVEAARSVTKASVEGHVRFTRQPFRTPEDAAIVRTLRAHLPETPLVGLPFWTDGAVFSSAGLPTVIYGPIGEGAHTPHEWVSLQSMINVFSVVRDIA